jgi:chaperonin GroEL
VVGKVRELPEGHGLNVDTGEYVDLIAEGIIDPAMVTRSALANAASIAKNIITTEALVVETPEEGGGAGGPMMSPNMGGMGGMGGMM